MTAAVLGATRRTKIFSMAMLYAGKTAGILVAFVFLPLYSSRLGPEQFGVVAVILSLQALLTMLDLGMAVLVTRDFAMATSNSAASLRVIRAAEFALSGFYAALLTGAVLFKAFGGLPSISWATVVLAVLLFWLLVLQNLYYSGMLARRAYTEASILQVAGVALRAVATAAVLVYLSATVMAFVVSQVVFGALHLLVTRYIFDHMYRAARREPAYRRPRMGDALALLGQGKSLALFSLAGAAVTQLDKPIITSWISAASVSPYFLATTLCMVPISVLAGPVSQYFQPTLLNAMAQANPGATRRVIVQFTAALLVVTFLPAMVFWLLRVPMVGLWLGARADPAVAHYVGILLPGFTIGALGFIPYSLLVSAKDFRFQALLSVGLTVTTLAAVLTFAMRHSIIDICFIYVGYHVASTLLSWIRALLLPATADLAKVSFSLAAVAVLAAAAVLMLLRY